MLYNGYMNNNHYNLMKDLAIIAISVVIAMLLVKSRIIVDILTSSIQLELLGSFIAGMFFTSVFTVAPATVTLGEIARENFVILVALIGGLGAVVGDLIIFRFVRDRFGEHLKELVKYNSVGKRLKTIFRLRCFRWFAFFVGGLIIASPFPDELGIALMGFSKMKTLPFMVVSFIFNSLGILIIGLVAKSL